MSTSAPSNPSQFKGWTLPGPRVPGGISCAELEGKIGEAVSLDAISGHFRIFQLKKGHRFSTDDLLVALYGTQYAPCAQRILELGSGIGTIGMLAAFRVPGARFTTVEAQGVSVRLARASLAYNGLSDRFDLREGDFRSPEIFQDGEVFDLVLGSPPYFPSGSGVEGEHPQKVACRFETRGDIADYARVARARLAPGGVFACVFPVDPLSQRERVEKAAELAGLRILRSRDVIFREGSAPLIGVFLMGRREDTPIGARLGWKEPPLLIRDQAGVVSPEYQTLKLSMGFPPE